MYRKLRTTIGFAAALLMAIGTTARAKFIFVATLLSGLLLLFGFGTGAFAYHGPAGSHLVAVGPVDPAHGFPIWYQDSNGLTVELCLETACGLDPALELPFPDQPVSFPNNFPEEQFWWAAEALMKTPSNNKVLLVLALEAAFFPEVIARENEVSFGRVRVRMTKPKPGATYVVTHPYGKDTIALAPDEDRLFVTEDGGESFAPFTGALTGSRIGPFLTPVPGSCPPPPAGQVGDAVSECQVTGSPFGTNYFRVEGPGVAGTNDPRKNLFKCPDKPLSLDCIQTDRFVVLGKKATKYGAGVTRATYTQGAFDPGVEVFAFTRAPDARPGIGIPQQDLALSIGTTVTPMVTDGSGKYFAFVEGQFPPTTTITVTNTSNVNDGPNTATTSGVVDVVTIKEAYINRATRTLEIVAASSDEVTPLTLTAYGDDGTTPLGVLTSGSEGLMLVVPNVIVGAGDAGSIVPPRQVTVKSSLGGSAAQLVDIGLCERAGASQNCR